MKAIVAQLVGRRRVELIEQDLEPREDEVLVAVKACGICHGDVQIFDRDHASPRTFGHEPVGQVVACGPWVRTLKEGDWVVGCLTGSFATHVVARESDAFAVPESLREEASLAEPLKCVTTVARAASPDFGDTVVVVGCGFMGLTTISVLARTWRGAIIAVDPVESRRTLAAQLGADHTVDPAGCDARQQIIDLTGGRGADVAVEFAGRREAVTLAARVLRTRGRLVLGGGHSVGDANNVEIYMKGITVHHAPPAFSPDQADDWRRAVAAMAAGRFPLSRLISHRFALGELQHALESASPGGEPAYLKGIVQTSPGPR